MKRIFLGVSALILGAATWGAAQSLEDLNIQIHGYATQGFLYTTQNNILTTNSSVGSAAWTEAVVNVAARPAPGLRIAVQARYQLLGNYADGITLDWAAADYTANDRFGVRFGKVKIPSGLFNDIQDIDPAYMWSLLPQGVYPLPSRNGQLAIYGGVVYGSIGIPSKFGKLEYRGWGGQQSLQSNDGYFTSFNEGGIAFTGNLSGPGIGAALHYQTPLHGLMVGSSIAKRFTGSAPITVANGAVPGSFIVFPYESPDFFVRYDRKKLMLAAEYNRLAGTYAFQFAGPAATPIRFDSRSSYVMGSYKLTEKLSAGVYYSQIFGFATPVGTPSRYQKDWVVSGRYDINPYLYAKVEEHFIDGTEQSYDVTLNPNGLKPDTRLTVLKIGINF
jgi:hypothetical protein